MARFKFCSTKVTGTSFEGEAECNPQAQRGLSRDQRSGNKYGCIGLVRAPEGMPLRFKVFAGNRADMGTVENIVRVMKTKYSQAERILVMAPGMVSEADITFLRERKARYLIGTPKGWRCAYSSSPTASRASATCYFGTARGPTRSTRCSNARASGWRES